MAYTSPQNPCQNSVQLQTTKANQLIISGTRFFGDNLTTDLKPDSQKELKNVGSMLFPYFLAMPKFWAKYLVYITCQILGLRLWQPQDAWFLLGKKNSHGFPLNHALIKRLGTIFKKISSLKSPNLILKNIKIAISIWKWKMVPGGAFCAQFGLPHIFDFLSTRIRHFGEYSGVL